MNLHAVNTLSPEAFVATFGGCYEHSPWIADIASHARPFVSLDALLEAFRHAVQTSSEEQQMALIRAHPELGHRAGIDPDLGDASASEQAGAGLDRLTPAEYERFRALNNAYLARFDMPFIICVRLAGTGSAKDIIMTAMQQRLSRTAEEERLEALRQIDAIASLRIRDIVTP